jgi:tetratricopeptide (TPR) repeat protein
VQNLLAAELANNKPHAMIQMYQDMIEREPLSFWHWHCLCQIYIINDNIERAKSACLIELATRPTNPSPLMQLQNLYAATGNYTAAIDTSERLFAMRPSLLQLAFKSLNSSLTVANPQELDMKAFIEE